MMWIIGIKTFASAHHRLHHVGLCVSQGFGGEEHVGYAVVPDHLQDHGAGTEGAAPTASVPAPGREANTDRKPET